MLHKVYLRRNAAIGDKTWEHADYKGACMRAQALATMHSTRAVFDATTLTFTVDASEYYMGAQPINVDDCAINPHRRIKKG